MQAKLVESEGSEGSTEARDYSKQNSYIRSDNNIQDNYKKSHSNTTNSNNIITQWIMKRLYLVRSLHSHDSLHHSQGME